MKRAVPVLAGLGVVTALGMAALAVVLGAPAWCCAAAVALAVAAWDLALVIAGAPRGADPAQEARVVRAHLGALALGLSPGIALVALLGSARLTLPFGAVVALALVALVALDRAWRRL